MIVGIVIGMLITIYFAWILWKKSRAFKQGKVCCSGCSNCPIKKYCEK